MTNNVRDGRYYLTGPQRHVLTLMGEGWMACSAADGTFVQQGRIGYGGKAENIRKDTLHALCLRGLVDITWHGLGSSHYIISTAGREAVAQGWTPTRKGP